MDIHINVPRRVLEPDVSSSGTPKTQSALNHPAPRNAFNAINKWFKCDERKIIQSVLCAGYSETVQVYPLTTYTQTSGRCWISNTVRSQNTTLCPVWYKDIDNSAKAFDSKF